MIDHRCRYPFLVQRCPEERRVYRIDCVGEVHEYDLGALVGMFYVLFNLDYCIYRGYSFFVSKLDISCKYVRDLGGFSGYYA